MRSVRSCYYDYNSHMSRTSISGLKARLSHYLREVTRGGEVEILDRGVPVARLTGVARGEGANDERRERLIRAGVLRPGETEATGILDLEPLDVPTSLLDALEEERKDRV